MPCVRSFLGHWPFHTRRLESSEPDGQTSQPHTAGRAPHPHPHPEVAPWGSDPVSETWGRARQVPSALRAAPAAVALRTTD